MRAASAASRAVTPVGGVSAAVRSERPTAAAEPPPLLLVEKLELLEPRPRRVAIGNFDGVHRGHAAIIRGCDTVLTFDPHPQSVVPGGRAPKLLTSLRAKAMLVAELGVREMVVLAFDESVAQQSPESFVAETLLDRLSAVHLSVGSNFRYGWRGTGDVESLRAHTEFTTVVNDFVRVDGEVVSSTRVRDLLHAGRPREAARLLGRPHRMPCRVVGSDLRSGRGGDVRSARVELPGSYACPPPGRYVCAVQPRGAGSHRTVCAVEVLPRTPLSGDEIGDVQAVVTGHADPDRTEELSLAFLRADRMPAMSQDGTQVGTVA